jgi:hypothetical protein
MVFGFRIVENLLYQHFQYLLNTTFLYSRTFRASFIFIGISTLENWDVKVKKMKTSLYIIWNCIMKSCTFFGWSTKNFSCLFLINDEIVLCLTIPTNTKKSINDQVFIKEQRRKIKQSWHLKDYSSQITKNQCSMIRILVHYICKN